MAMQRLAAPSPISVIKQTALAAGRCPGKSAEARLPVSRDYGNVILNAAAAPRRPDSAPRLSVITYMIHKQLASLHCLSTRLVWRIALLLTILWTDTCCCHLQRRRSSVRSKLPSHSVSNITVKCRPSRTISDSSLNNVEDIWVAHTH